MPKWLEEKLAKQGRKDGLSGKDLANYIYGTMTNIEKSAGGKPIKKPAKGKR